MLDKKGFDNWAGSYDETINKSSVGYPFEGYYDVLSFVQNKVETKESTNILDLGMGTGLLTNEIYKRGGNIVGVDFSENMILEASTKMPNATFFCYDFNDELPPEIHGNRFDFIISSYAIHHINDERKVKLFEQLSKSLKSGGKIIIADIAFEDEEHLEKVKHETGTWDEDEYYIVADQFLPKVDMIGYESKYYQISNCAGVIEMTKC